MLRSSLIVAAGALMLAVLDHTSAFAGGIESPIVRFRPGHNPDLAAIPAPLMSPRWQYSAAYYNRPRGPRYFHFMGAARPYSHYRWWR